MVLMEIVVYTSASFRKLVEIRDSNTEFSLEFWPLKANKLQTDDYDAFLGLINSNGIGFESKSSVLYKL